MRILYIDIDTLRPDHLSCYGYGRKTSPNIDEIAKRGIIFTNCFVSDAPCLPSRAAMFSGRFGIHNGVVGHGGTAADPFIVGVKRGFSYQREYWGFVELLKKAGGFYTVSVSPFAERHSAWWFCASFREFFNPGKGGMEIATDVYPYAEEWLRKNAEKDNWFLHINFWDPHTPYRTPKEERVDLGPIPPQVKWLTQEIIDKHLQSFGPHSAREPFGIGEKEVERWWKSFWEDIPTQIDSPEAFYRWIEGYDQGIRFADKYVGKILEILEEKGVLDDTAIIVTADHAENIGELNVYGDHQTADYITNRVPFILKWPGLEPGINNSLYYQVDLAATILGLLNIEIPKRWDGIDFSEELKRKAYKGRDYLVISNCAWSCQRSVVWKDWLMIRTYHEGLKDFPKIMLFNIKEDPHEVKNLAEEREDIVGKCMMMLDEWYEEMMNKSDNRIDPMQTVLKEGGPYHTREDAEAYAKRLKETGREKHAEKILNWLKEGRYWR